MLEPKLPEPLTWPIPGVELIDSIEELRAAVEAPYALLEKLMKEAAGPAAIKLAIARLKLVLEPSFRTAQVEGRSAGH